MEISIENRVLGLFSEGSLSKAAIGRLVSSEYNKDWDSEKSRDFVRKVIRRNMNSVQKVNINTQNITIITPKPDKVNFTQKGDNIELESNGRIFTLEQLLEKSKVDTNIWEVERHIINKWEVGTKKPDGTINTEELYQVKAWLKKNKVGFDYQELRKQFIEDSKNYAPVYEPIKYEKTDDKYLLEISIYDMHIGKLAWDEESGENYDSKISASLFIKSVEELIKRCQGYNISQIIFPIGNDILHTDNGNDTTTSGTQVTTDTRYHKMFRIARQACVMAIERLMVIAPVVVKIIPGNHDRERCFYLGEALEGWFSNCPNVIIDNAPTLRKYYQYGQNMLLFTHGSEEKVVDLPLIMATEEKDMWASTKFREVHIGHLHIKQSMQFRDISEHKGVRIRTIPSLCAADDWHVQKGYIGSVRSAEAFLWNKENGCEAQLSYNL